MSKNSLTIDGVKIPFQEGQSIMQAATVAGIYIPHLCYHPEYKAHGSCKLCNIKVNGHTCTACTTPASVDQDIQSNTEDLNTSRRAITQMLFVEGNHICPACEKSGNCQLQAVAYHLKMLDNHYPHFFPHRELDASHPDIVLDRDRCIFCELCVRASQDTDKKNVFAIAGRGINAHLIVNSTTGKLGDSALIAEDQAAQICPVGAILSKNHAYETPIGERKYDTDSIQDECNKTHDRKN